MSQTEWIPALALYLSSSVTLGKLLTTEKEEDSDSRYMEGKWTRIVADWLYIGKSQK